MSIFWMDVRWNTENGRRPSMAFLMRSTSHIARHPGLRIPSGRYRTREHVLDAQGVQPGGDEFEGIQLVGHRVSLSTGAGPLRRPSDRRAVLD